MMPQRWTTLLELAALFAIALALRLQGVGESLWLDELFTAWVAVGSDGTINQRAEYGNASAAYYWLVRVSVACFGLTEWAVRLPSLAFGSAVPLVVCALAHAMTGSRWGGRVAGLLAALDGLCVAYAAEARPYPLLQFFGGLQLLAFWNLAVRGRSAWRVVFIGATVAVGYLQFTSLTLIAGEVAFYLVLYVRGERPSYRPLQFFIDLTASGILLLPLVPLILAVAGRKANFLLTAATVGIEDLVTAHRQVVYLLLPAVGATIVSLAWPKRTQSARPDHAQTFLFLLVVFYATAVPLWALHRFGGTPLFRPRYSSILYLLPLAGAGVLATLWPRRIACAAFVLVALVLSQVTEGPLRRLSGSESPRLTHEDWREATAWVNERGGGRPTPVFVGAGFIEADGYLNSSEPITRAYLNLPVATIYPLKPAERVVRPLTFAGDLPGDADEAIIREAGEAWFLVKFVRGEVEFADKAVARLVERLARAGVTVEVTDRKTWRNVTAFRVRCPPVTRP